LKRQVDWLVNGSLTGPIFSRALNQLTQLEIFPARDKDWPVNVHKMPPQDGYFFVWSEMLSFLPHTFAPLS